ncbi:helical backbone metal receptor [Psychrosphaera aestuarii]|uniref:helical backbone metal receptor n=1 Tax=Psychrosphaera aestuarii TaxID=1266052 RepID=UPI001B32EF33|nr:helical backbone metal receptor [Psychrosphaera aestuarii]
MQQKKAKIIISIVLVFFTISALASQKSEKIDTAPNKIIALAPNLVEIVFALGAGDQLVGVSEHSDFPEVAKTRPTVSNYLTVNAEAIVKLNPDLIIVWQGGTPSKGIEKLQSLGFEVLTFNATDFKTMISEITRLATRLGKTQEALVMTRELMIKYKKVERDYSSKRQLNGFIEIWPEPLTTATKGTIIDQAIELCGVKNVFDSRLAKNNTYPQVSLEMVISKPVDIIIQPVSKTQPAAIKDWRSFKHLNAVKFNSIISPDSDVLLRWTPRWVNALAELCKDIDETRLTQNP